jgi:gluconolactonase
VYFTDPRYVGDDPRDLDFEGVFVVEPDGTVKVATREVEKPNGILVSPDGGTVYVADHNNATPDGARSLLAFDVQAGGTLANKRVLFRFPPGKRAIDGMTQDVLGNIYATAGSGQTAGIHIFSPAGERLVIIPLPGDPTNCVFGVGAESTTLYITSQGPKPLAGAEPAAPRRYGLYRIKLKVPGYHPW